MSETRITRSVEAELQLDPDGNMRLRFCDAQVAQWDEAFDNIAGWTDDGELRAEIEQAIEDAASDLAESLVRDLRERVLDRTPVQQNRTQEGQSND